VKILTCVLRVHIKKLILEIFFLKFTHSTFKKFKALFGLMKYNGMEWSGMEYISDKSN
jgi:hypothetical protein